MNVFLTKKSLYYDGKDAKSNYCYLRMDVRRLFVNIYHLPVVSASLKGIINTVYEKVVKKNILIVVGDITSNKFEL